MSDLVAFMRARLDEWAQDPARVREVEAMRAIVDAYEAVLGECATMLRDRRPRKYGEHDGLRIAVANLAAVWRDHPDYDPGWAP
jgi:hypothetical protein